MINKAFKKAFDKLINRLLLEEDYKKISNTNLDQIKKLISYYQITKQDEKNANKNNKKINIFLIKIAYTIFFIVRIFFILTLSVLKLFYFLY
ncbi:hypothetical protein OAM59_05155 [Pelagibacteraceae bacterium]|nr:hypothetical protein [Pelagibacteraceae bacterium]